MKKSVTKIFIILSIVCIIFVLYFVSGRDGQIRLIVRGDDMGFSHAANIGCMKAYREGILTTVEIMVPCDDFPEAVSLLKENPSLDVGIHLTLNSEWENIKWGPITNAPSLVDENGYFLPTVWPDETYPADKSLGTAEWNPIEIERELRAQIELALFHLPQLSHATPHMGFHTISPAVQGLVVSLMREYDLDANLRLMPLKELSLFEDAQTPDDMISSAVRVLENLGPGTWQVVEHPGMIIEGEEGAWHFGAEWDAGYRDATTKALVSNRLQEVIKRRDIQLIGYRDLTFWH